MGMGESQIPSHPKSHPKSHHPIPFVIIPSQSQIPSQIPFKSHLNPVIVEGQKYHHSNRLVETSRMVVFSFFYDHWMLSYLTKRLSGAVPNVIKCRFDDI